MPAGLAEVRQRARLDRPVPVWPFVAARIYVGLVFATAGVRQLEEAAPWVTAGQHWPDAVRDQLAKWEPHSATWYHPILTQLLVPHVDTIAPLIAWANVLIGMALVLGVGTRLVAILGLVLLLNYMAAAGGRLYFPGPTAAYTALLLALVLAGAGQMWSVDAALARRWPRASAWWSSASLSGPRLDRP